MKTYFSISTLKYTTRQVMGDITVKERSFLLIKLDIVMELHTIKIKNETEL